MDGILHLSEGAQECLTSLSACAVLLGDVSPAGMLPAITLLQINAQKAEDVEALMYDAKLEISQAAFRVERAMTHLGEISKSTSSIGPSGPSTRTISAAIESTQSDLARAARYSKLAEQLEAGLLSEGVIKELSHEWLLKKSEHVESARALSDSAVAALGEYAGLPADWPSALKVVAAAEAELGTARRRVDAILANM